MRQPRPGPARHPLACVAALLLLAVCATPAVAHPDVAPKELAPGETSQVVINLTHGCDDEALEPTADAMEPSPTTQVFLEVPPDIAITAAEPEDWSVEAERDRIVWSADDPAGVEGSVQLPIEVAVPDLPGGTDLWLPLVQGCANGMAVAWTHPGTTRGGDAMPAMRVIVRDDAGDEPRIDAPAVDPRRYGPPAVVAAAGLTLALLGRWTRTHRSRRRAGR